MKKWIAAISVIALVLIGAVAGASASAKSHPAKPAHRIVSNHACIPVQKHAIKWYKSHSATYYAGDGGSYNILCIVAKSGKDGVGAPGPRCDRPDWPARPQRISGKDGTNGTDGKDGATGPAGPAELESWRSCSLGVCIDADPAPGGSGGWGWDDAANAPERLTAGQTYPFVVTVVQDHSQNANGTITLTWNPSDFTGPTFSSDSSANCQTLSTGNGLSCTYTGLGASIQERQLQLHRSG